MKRSFLFLAFLFCFSLLQAQAPQGINYQAVARDADGNLLAETAIAVQFDILAGSTDGPPVYSETHEVTTSSLGLFTAIIGQGTVESGVFEDIAWSADSYFLQLSIDENIIGTSPFLSVPYALSTAPKKGIASVPGAVFRPNTSGPGWYASAGQGGAEITIEGGTSVNVLVAPISLPHGARLTTMTVYFKDESSENISISLDREALTGGGFSPVANIQTTGDDAAWRSASLELEGHIVDNDNYGYYLRVFVSNWDADGTKAVKGVKIEYMH
jgi:hypothetical protein